MSDAVRESLIASMDSDELRAAAEQLDTDEIADLAPDLPHEVIQGVFESLDKEEQAQLQSALPEAFQRAQWQGMNQELPGPATVERAFVTQDLPLHKTDQGPA